MRLINEFLTMARALARPELDETYQIVDAMYEHIIGPADGLCNSGWWSNPGESPSRALARAVLDLVGEGTGARVLEVPASGGGYAALDHSNAWPQAVA